MLYSSTEKCKIILDTNVLLFVYHFLLIYPSKSLLLMKHAYAHTHT